MAHRILATLLVASLLPACDCFDAKVGELKLTTDCSGEITESSLAYLQAPSAGINPLDFLPSEELKSRLGDAIDCEALQEPESLSDLCTPLGIGGGTEALDVSGTDARVIFCGSTLSAVGSFNAGGNTGLFTCSASKAIVEGQVWFMSCEKLTADAEPQGTCQAVAEFDATELTN